MRARVEQAGKARVQRGQPPFECAQRQRRQRGAGRFVESNDAGDGIGPGGDLGEVGGNPAGVDARVGVGRHDDAVGGEQRDGTVEGSPTGTARMGLRVGQDHLVDHDPQADRDDGAGNRGGRIGAVVGQYHGGDGPVDDARGDVERVQGSADAVGLIARGQGDRGTARRHRSGRFDQGAGHPHGAPNVGPGSRVAAAAIGRHSGGIITGDQPMNRVLAHTGARYPIVQAPMGWIARSTLASAVCNAGGLGIIETSSGETETARPKS